MHSPDGLADHKIVCMNFSELNLVVPVLIALNTTTNQLFLHRPKNEAQDTSASIAVIIPIRNEASNIEPLLESLKNQTGTPNLQFHLINDNSTDETYKFALRATQTDSRFKVHQGKALQQDWLGKPFAMQQGLQLSDSEYVVLVDADVRLEPFAIASAINLMSVQHLDFISAYPREIAHTWSERLIQPLLQWSWLATVPLGIARRSTNPALAVANGQFFLVRRKALEKIGDFNPVKNKVLDDINLARALLSSGFHGSVVDGSQIAQCRMYESWTELREGYSKSLPVAFGGLIGTCLAIIFLSLTGIVPIIFALCGSSLAWMAFAAIAYSRILSALATKGRVIDSLFHPLSVLLLIYLIVRSHMMRGTTQWKGRTL